MKPSRSIPLSLKVVAYLFIIIGVLSLLEVVLAILVYRISINIGIIGIFIGIGLLRLSPLAYTWAKIFTCINFIYLLSLIVLFLTRYQELRLLNQNIATAPLYYVLPSSIAAISLVGWQYFVLVSRKVKRLFAKE